MDPQNYVTHLLECEREVPLQRTPADSFQDVSCGKEQAVQRFQPYCVNERLLQGSLESKDIPTEKQETLNRRKIRQLQKERRNYALRRHGLRCECVSSGHIQTPIQKHNDTQLVPDAAHCFSVIENNALEENVVDDRVQCSFENRVTDEQSSEVPMMKKMKIKSPMPSTASLPTCKTSVANITSLPLRCNCNPCRKSCALLNHESCDRVSSVFFISNTCNDADSSTFSSSAQLLKNSVYPQFVNTEDPSILFSSANSQTILMPKVRFSSLAWHAANRIIRHARNNKSPNIQSLLCVDCNKFPNQPVTGKCGHTRCSKCIEDNGPCTCGTPPPNKLFVNTVIQDIIENMASRVTYESRCKKPSPGKFAESEQPLVKSRLLRENGMEHLLGSDAPNYFLMNHQNRFKLGRELLSARHYKRAAVHLARVAAAAPAAAPLALRRQARSLLVKGVSEMCVSGEVRRVTREVCRMVGGGAWVRRGELECALCYHTYTSPVTTPCGHTYCRTCLERSLDYKKACALCLRPLHDFHLASTSETVFICAALASIDALTPPLPMGPDVIPIFVCTVAFPGIPCPLFIFDPRYWLMIRRVLESGSRKFGMVAYERGNTYSDYGTVLEVCDCVHFEDGRSILSTVGVSRFKIIERDIREGCEVARIEPLIDEAPTEEKATWDMRLVAAQISYKAMLWLNSMSRSIRGEIEAAFGHLPHIDCSDDGWWERPDGPAWLWWLIAILPLRAELKILILSTKSLIKRMLAVSRTLDVIDHVALSATFSSEYELRNSFTGAQDWLESNS